MMAVARAEMQAVVARAEEDGSPAGQQLARLARDGMSNIERIFAEADFSDPKDKRLVADLSLGVMRAAIRVDESQMRQRGEDRLGELLAQLSAARLSEPKGS